MLFNDLRFALRQLQKNPGYILAVIFTLALGVGVNTAVFSLVNGFLLRPLPYPDPDRIGVLMLHQEGIFSRSGQFYQEDSDSQDGETWEMFRDNVPTVQAASFGGASGVNLQASSASGANIRYVQDMRVSAHYFDVLGIQPFLGRGFSIEEDRPNGPNAVILSYSLWKSVFQGDPQVLGKPVTVKGEPYTIVGVLPPHAQATGIADLWTPLQPHQSGECGGDNCEIIMRLAPGATWQQVSAQLSHFIKALRRDRQIRKATPGSTFRRSRTISLPTCAIPYSDSCPPSPSFFLLPAPISPDSLWFASSAAPRKSPLDSPSARRAGPFFVNSGSKASFSA